MLRPTEHSYRSLLIELNVAMLRTLSDQGLAKMREAGAEKDAAKRRAIVHGPDGPARIAMDCADIVGTINWLHGLPDDLCPDVPASETLPVDELFARMQVDETFEDIAKYAASRKAAKDSE